VSEPPSVPGSHFSDDKWSDDKWSDDKWQAFVERLYRQNEFAIKLGLEAVDEALRLEGRPETSHPAILVGGTNGKGETAAFLSSILAAHGLKVGLYTSPHIMDFRERFRVDGELMSRSEVLELGQGVLARYGEADGPGPQLTFFEITTVMAVLGFAAHDVDVAVYEVGLGGRLDATNALPAELSVVTSIALDHKQYLGETLEEVAAEKAGIFRPTRPAVVGHQAHAAAKETLRKLAPQEASFYGDDFWAEDDGAFVIGGRDVRIEWRAGLPQTRRWNAACAIQAASRYLGDRLDLDRLREGLDRSRWPGRLDFRSVSGADKTTRQFLFDAAHNPDASRSLFDFIADEGIEIGAVVFSAMKDKDLAGVISAMPSDLPVFAVTLESDRGASAEQLQGVIGESLVAVGQTAAMLKRAQARVGVDTKILVFGSIYLLGECFEQLGVDADSLVTYAR
jgi:dihydrofolate synthase/folylpolyglutamate synthase